MIYRIFKDKVKLYPNHTAFVLESGKSVTYSQASALIDKLASVLYQKGVRAGHRVGLITNNESEHPFVFYALNKLNATYVPFDISIPEKQLELDKAKLKLHHFFDEEDLKFKAGADFPAPAEIEYDHSIPVYIVSSSGTSGDKKWIPIRGEGLAYWEEAEQALFKFSPGHKVLCTRSPGYDARISEYLRALISGGTLHLISQHERKDLNFIVDYCEKHKIQTILMIASQLQGDDLEDMFERLSKAGLQHLIVTGDACSPRLRDLCIQYQIKLINAYGPTEACFGVSLIEANQLSLVNELGHPVVPIGFPYGDKIKLHLIDGKLYIESPYLTEGYFEDPEKTKELFSIKTIQNREVRVFDTGDKFEIQQGLLRYKGRDKQSNDVKISGVKVDINSIENHAKAYPGIDQVCVVVKLINESKSLVIYLTANPEFNSMAFIQHSRSMIPADLAPVFIQLASLPLKSVSSKIDSQALINRKDSPDEYLKFSTSEALPNDSIMQTLIEIWKELLNHEPTSLEADFRFSGGTSVLAKRLVAQLQAKLDPSFVYQDLMKMEVISLGRIYERVKSKKSTEVAHNQALHTLFSKGSPVFTYNLFILPPLLGDGNALKTLGENYNQNENQKGWYSIYGLTDPSIYGFAPTPTSMDEAVDRYVKTIQKIQPNGPYHLMGYSYGSILAYNVAVKLQDLGHAVWELHLVDGFSPLFYQKITPAQHARLLEEFAGFIAEILNNEFYNENIEHFNYKIRESENKESQINLLIDALQSKVKNQPSQAMLNLVKAHLLFLIDHKPPKKIHNDMTRLYLSKPGQNFISLIDEIPGIQKGSFDHIYYYWNQYVDKIRRCELIAQTDHLSLITKKESSQLFFNYSPVLIQYIPMLYEYSIVAQQPYLIRNSDDYSLMICNQPYFVCEFYKKDLIDNQLCSEVEAFRQDIKFYNTKKPEDSYYQERYVLIGKFPKNKLSQVKKYIDDNLDKKEHKSKSPLVKLGVSHSITDTLTRINNDGSCTAPLRIEFYFQDPEPIEFRFDPITITVDLLDSLIKSKHSKWMKMQANEGHLVISVIFNHTVSGYLPSLVTIGSFMEEFLPIIMPYRLNEHRKSQNSSYEVNSVAETEKLSQMVDNYKKEHTEQRRSKCSIM